MKDLNHNSLGASPTFTVTLLDIADTLQILFTQKTPLYKAALQLYKVVDPSADYVDTQITVKSDEREIIRKTLGNEYVTKSWDIDEAMSSLSKDIKIILQYEQIRERNIHRTESIEDVTCHADTRPSQGEKEAKQVLADEKNPPLFFSSFKNLVDPADLVNFNKKNDSVKNKFNVEALDPLHNAYLSYTGAEYSVFDNVESAITTVQMTVLWNSILDMSIIFEETGINLASADATKSLCEISPTFSIIKVISVKPDDREVTSKMFHRKVFKSLQELEHRLNCFQDLYRNDREDGGKLSEREMVQMVLKTHFIISNNNAERMQSSQLIELICTKLSTACSAFKSRIPGYLLESGLSKKRFATGNYYYGIRPTVTMDMSLSKANSVEELRRQRDDQLDSIKKSGALSKPKAS